MWVVKAGNWECQLKAYENRKSKLQKSEIAQWKNDKGQNWWIKPTIIWFG